MTLVLSLLTLKRKFYAEKQFRLDIPGWDFMMEKKCIQFLSSISDSS